MLIIQWNSVEHLAFIYESENLERNLGIDLGK